jgi:anti-anti-sigma factor
MTALHLHTEIRDAHVTVTLIGELDAQTAPTFATFVETVPVRPDVIDARYVTFIDAAGLRTLLTKRAQSGCRIVASVVVARLITIVGTDVPLIDEPFGPPRLDSAQFAVAVHDTDLRYDYVNRRLATINGLPVARHIGKRPQDLFDIERDDITGVLHGVLHGHAPVEVTIAGATAAGSTDCWTCNYHPVRWMLGDDVIRQIVAVVEPTPPSDAALSIKFGATSGQGA